MSRNLSVAQKKALREYQDKHPDCDSVNDMDPDTWDKIDMMHPCEVNWQNANRYLNDRRVAKLNSDLKNFR